MFEKPSTIETTAEHIPTREEIRALFEVLLEGKQFEDIRTREDEKGLYLWDIRLRDQNESGETVEYTYMRTGRYPEGKADKTAIHVYFLDADGIPAGGTSVAKYLNGEWVRG